MHRQAHGGGRGESAQPGNDSDQDSKHNQHGRPLSVPPQSNGLKRNFAQPQAKVHGTNVCAIII